MAHVPLGQDELDRPSAKENYQNLDELTRSNQLQMRRLYGDAVDQLFARENSSGTLAWYLTDRLGSVRDVLNNSSTVIDHIDYDGFGNATETNSANGDRYKWTAREFDGETLLQYKAGRR